MGRIAAWLQALALSIGAPGLFLVAFLDSSFLSLPEIADLLVILTIAQHKTGLVLYVAAATLGSLGGCLIMYYLGRRGGEALLHKRFTPAAIERAMAALRRNGLLAVIVPALLPPPAPFKIFVLIAGAAEIGLPAFVTAILIGRGTRYLVLGILTIRYGDLAMEYARDHTLGVSLAALGVPLAVLAIYMVWRKVRSRRQE